APAFPGAIDGTLASTGATRDDGGLDAGLDATGLGGTLRGRRLAGRVHVEMQGGVPGVVEAGYAGDVDLTLGASRLSARGRLADRVQLDARFDPLQLDDLLPAAAGSLRGSVAVAGTRTAPEVTVDLAGRGLRHAGYTADSVRVQGRMPWSRGSGTLGLDASGVNAGLALERLSVNATGAVENLALEADARGAMGTLALAGNLQRRGRGWQGALDALRLAPERGAPWQLQAPARFSQDGSRFTLGRSCFSSGQGALCAEADWPRRGIDIDGKGLPLALVAPYLPARDDGRPWILRGEIAIDAQARPAGAAYAGHLRVTSPGGGLRLSTQARRDFVDYSDLAFDATFDARQVDATLGTGFNGEGRIDARVRTGWEPTAPLDGELGFDIRELTWLELFSPDIVEPKGALTGRISLGGTRAAPALGGQARLSAFTTELPALGIVLEAGDVRLDALPDGSARIVGSVASGEGTLQVDGTLGWRGDAGGQAAPLVLNLRGTNVLVSDTRDLRAVASPELVVRIAAADPISVTGRVRVPSATIDLERLDQGRSVSADVVVLDPVDPDATTAASALDLDL
ncbi:MAG TPA: translocation/assembly module TamB domain-containing protein, partial [Luteimonas sp.]|nr:translocation/assembly module TamB domain-containing protein [Luteimonas sp.]